MIRNYITPQDSSILITVPPNYVGKPLEILVYTVDELVEEKPETPNTMAAYKGLLSADEAKELQQHITQSREEWDNI